MNILPRHGLLQFRNAARIYRKPVTESLQLFKQETKLLKVTLWISHQPNQLEELDSAINFLKGFGVLIYADWLDEEHSIYNTNIQDSKEKKEKRIKENRKFIFLATEEAIDSKECKWELRYANTQKSIDQIAILPVRKDYTDYSGSAYLQKYPYIQKSDHVQDRYEVKYPDGSIEELGAWLSS
ncbi:TIR domain-containing protein [Aquimarina pacifica]|uniref:TIR domain-containing protein n=1 Tax=Aquimarina pacifica TaxID=1296415 RepID=UPI0004714BBE|nr:TIR domain-containing protein [Aquimarina pacifica]